MTWIYAYPTWLVMVLAVIISGALSAGGLLIVRRRVRAESLTHNDVAGPIISTVGTILAVLLAFMLVTAWQQYDAAAAIVTREAAAVADLHHLADGLPNPPRRLLKSQIDAYIDAVINDEWPKMQVGLRSEKAHQIAYAISRTLLGFRARDSSQQIMQSAALQLSRNLDDARRDRLFENDQGISMQLWFTLLFASVITILFTYFFRVASFSSHLMMTVALTVVVAVILVLIAEYDYPFRGDIHVTPAAFEHVKITVHDEANADF